MPISVQPLVIHYSFYANHSQAQDKVDLVQLDSVFVTINNKITEIIDAINTIQRDDDALSDQSIELRNLNDNVLSNLSAQVNTAVAASA